MQPVQLQLGFANPSRTLTLRLTLAGTIVLVDTEPAREHDARTLLANAGAQPFIGDVHGLAFPVTCLVQLTHLPDTVTVDPGEDLATLYRLVSYPPDGGKPAELTLDGGRRMWMAWFDGARSWTEPLADAAAVALAATDLPFVADPAAFRRLGEICHLPVAIGRAKVNLDRYIEITTSKPQLLESAPLPGLFRVDDTHYGLALPYADQLTSVRGFTWDGPPVDIERGPAQLPPMPIPLSAHANADLRQIVDGLAAYRAQAIVWPSGLGRRIFALAAVEALDAYPALIVCPPRAVWAWQRHLNLFGRTGSVVNLAGDAHIVTFHDLARRPNIGQPQTIIVDDFADKDTPPGAYEALRRLDGVMDAYRLSVATAMPTDQQKVAELMSVLRPGEFRPDIPNVHRYPPEATGRAAMHVEVYVSRREASSSAGSDFRRSTVVTVGLTSEQIQAQQLVMERTDRTRDAALAECLEIVSAGPALSLSPKIPAALRLVEEAFAAGRTVAVATRHHRTAALLKATLRKPGVAALDAATAMHAGVPLCQVAIIQFDRELPSLQKFDDVVVVDYPWSHELIDAAVGPAGASIGPGRVTVIHASNSIDDRLSLLAEVRRERAELPAEQSAYPSPVEVGYLLADLAG